VLRTLAKEPERRYQRAAEVKTAIESLDDEPQQAETPPARPTRKRGPLRGAVAAAGALAEGAAALASDAVSMVEEQLNGASPPSRAAGGRDGPTRVVEIRRPRGVTLSASYCIFWFVLVVPSMGTSQQVAEPRFPFEVLAIPAIAVAFGLWRLRRWGRIGAIVLAGIGCFFYFPAGFLLSAPVAVYLLRKDVRRVFDLGVGPATLDEEEATRLAKLVRERPKR
jgi:hypothetical protein